MPRIVAVKVGFLWASFTLDDYGKPGRVSLGLTEESAWDRAVRRLSIAAVAEEETNGG